MNPHDIEELKAALQNHWPGDLDAKAEPYRGRFFDGSRIGTKITGRVHGNHGIYRVSVESSSKGIRSACSCYIGKDGDCHHCRALAATFLNNLESFPEKTFKPLGKVKNLDDLGSYLAATSLETLLDELKSRGFTQKEFADAIGMNPRHLTVIKSSEQRNHYFYELGATKPACLWVIEKLKAPAKPTNRKKTGKGK